jgi:hypothetical protein
MLEAVVIDRLKEITALVDRVYINTIPQEDVSPYAAIFIISNTPSPVKDSVSRIDRERVQVSVYARTYLEAVNIRIDVREKLDGYEETDEAGETFRFTFENSYGEFDQTAELQGAISDYICEHKRV